MDYKAKYLKYKNKYLELKNKQRGGITSSGLPLEATGNIASYALEFSDCKDFFKKIVSFDKMTLNSINWDTLPEIRVNIAPEINLEIECGICNMVLDETKRNKCKIYYNKCKIIHLYKKYYGYRPDYRDLITITDLNNILMRTIERNNSQDHQNYLIELGANLNIIPRHRFFNYHLEYITIPNSVTTIDIDAFRSNHLTTVTIPNSVTTINDGAFSYNNLTSVILGDSITTIRVDAFRYNRLTSVTIPNSVTEISEGAFSNNLLTSVIIPNSVTRIGWDAFKNNRLTSVSIPEKYRKYLTYIFGTPETPIQFTFT